MAVTYTGTYTRQEKLIKDLNVNIAKTIRESFEGIAGAGYSYYGTTQDGSISEEKPLNLYEAGVLIGDDFAIHKGEGLVNYSGEDIHFVYSDETGEIHSFGEEYDKAYVLFMGGEKVSLLDFSEHPEAEEYIERVSKKFAEEKSDKRGHGL